MLSWAQKYLINRNWLENNHFMIAFSESSHRTVQFTHVSLFFIIMLHAPLLGDKMRHFATMLHT